MMIQTSIDIEASVMTKEILGEGKPASITRYSEVFRRLQMNIEDFESILSVALTSVGQIFPEKAILVFKMASKWSSFWKAN